jgi:hypothetical protein
VTIDWATLAVIAIVAAAAALTVVLLVAFALVAWSGRPTEPAAAPDRGGRVRATRPVSATATAVLCVSAAGLVVAYGLYLILA